MGHHKHVRVVINGSFAYNRGGDAYTQLLRDVNDRFYDPLYPAEGQSTLGLFYPLEVFKICRHLRRKEVKDIRLIFITRTRGGLRRIKEVHSYWYDKGKLYRKTRHTEIDSEPRLYHKDEQFYRKRINSLDIDDYITFIKET